MSNKKPRVTLEFFQVEDEKVKVFANFHALGISGENIDLMDMLSHPDVKAADLAAILAKDVLDNLTALEPVKTEKTYVQ